MTQIQPGWYPDPQQRPGLRRWDGAAWTDEYRPSTRTGLSLLLLFGGLIGAGLALFTQVSLLTGTGTVWTGVAIAAASFAVALFARRPLWVSIALVILLAAAVSSGVYDERQLQHKRDQISRILGP